MKWNELFPPDQMPAKEDMEIYIGKSKPFWDELVFHLEETYKPVHRLDFSKDSLQPGWNVKYRKNGRALCTLYPRKGYFLALVVVGRKEEDEVRHDMETGLFSSAVSELYQKSPGSTLGKWLMIEVKDRAVLKDIWRLLEIRIKPRHSDVK